MMKKVINISGRHYRSSTIWAVTNPTSRFIMSIVKAISTLTLRHNQYHHMPLDKSADEVLKHVVRLWGFDVRLETLAEDGSILATFECNLSFSPILHQLWPANAITTGSTYFLNALLPHPAIIESIDRQGILISGKRGPRLFRIPPEITFSEIDVFRKGFSAHCRDLKALMIFMKNLCSKFLV